MRGRDSARLRHPVEADAAEALVRRAAGRAIQGFLEHLRSALAHHPSLTAAAEPFDLQLQGQMSGWWAQEVDDNLIPTLAAIWQHGFYSQDTIASGLDAVPLYLAQVRDRLVPGEGPMTSPSIPADAFNMVRSVLVRNISTGASTEQIAQNLSATFGWDSQASYWREHKSDLTQILEEKLSAYGQPGDPAREMAKKTDPAIAALLQERNVATAKIDAVESTWQARATRIARTESTAALNAGALDALSKEGAAGKEWLATEDTRTRLAHRHADGQKRPLNQPFEVGGVPMMFPGDPVAPPELTVNCRCAMVGVEMADLPPGMQTPEATLPTEHAGQTLPWASAEQATHAALDAGEMPDWAAQLLSHTVEPVGDIDWQQVAAQAFEGVPNAPHPTGEAAQKLVQNLVGQAPAAPSDDQLSTFLSAKDKLAAAKAHAKDIGEQEQASWLKVLDASHELQSAKEQPFPNGDAIAAAEAKLETLKAENKALNSISVEADAAVYDAEQEAYFGAAEVIPEPVPYAAPPPPAPETVPAVGPVSDLGSLVGTPAPTPPTPPSASDFGWDGRTVAQAEWDRLIEEVAVQWDPAKSPTGVSWESSQLKSVLEGLRNSPSGSSIGAVPSKYHGGAMTLAQVRRADKIAKLALTPKGAGPNLPPAAAKKYGAAMARYGLAQKRYKAVISDWRAANQVPNSWLKGMSGEEIRDPFAEGGELSEVESRGKEFLHSTPGQNSAQGRAVQSYTGAGSSHLNRQLYTQPFDQPTRIPSEYKEMIAELDAAMRPAPFDMIVRRGTNKSELRLLDGRKASELHGADMLKLRGTVQQSKAYLSTSVGQGRSAFDGEVKITFRVPQGHGQVFAMPISSHWSEHEVILPRDTAYFIHDIWWDGAGWQVEAEILPDGVTPEEISAAYASGLLREQPLPPGARANRHTKRENIADVIIGSASPPGPLIEETAVPSHEPIENHAVAAMPSYDSPNWGGGGFVTAVAVPGEPDKNLGWLITGGPERPNLLVWLAIMPSPDDEWRRAMQDLISLAATQGVSVGNFMRGLRALGTSPFVLGSTVWADKLAGVVEQAMPGA